MRKKSRPHSVCVCILCVLTTREFNVFNVLHRARGVDKLQGLKNAKGHFVELHHGSSQGPKKNLGTVLKQEMH